MPPGDDALVPDDLAPDGEGPATAGGLALSRLFVARQPSGTRIRLPLTLVDADGTAVQSAPSRLAIRVGRDGDDLRPVTLVARHESGVPFPYFPLETTFGDEGAWRVVAEIEGTQVETVVSAVAPGGLPDVPGVGDRLPLLHTPTRRRPRGVDPLCTADPPCPLHQVSLQDALDGDHPIALLVTSPRTCATDVCASVLELLVAARTDDVTMIHVEASTGTPATPTTLARALELTFEPALFLAAPDGEVIERLDHIFDRRELDDALRRLRS